MANQIILDKIEYQQKLKTLEKEVLKLKKGAGFNSPLKVISLKGILKGIKIVEKDIEQAKESLFKEAKI